MSDKKYQDKSWLIKQRVTEGRSSEDIADECGVKPCTIHKWCSKHNIQDQFNTPYRNREWLYEEYIEKDRTLTDIANQFDLDKTAIQSWRQKLDIPKKKLSFAQEGKEVASGKKHGNYKGGPSGANYNTALWKKRAERARSRANHSCENPECEATRDSEGRKLDVHHIIPYRLHESSERAHILSNLVVLCRSCHRTAEPCKEVYA